MKKALCILVIFAMTVSLSACISKTETENIDEYYEYLAKVRYAEDYMPGEDHCGHYSSIHATYKRTILMFETYTVGLFLSYDEAEYQKQIEVIQSNYVFFNTEEDELRSDHDATVDRYNIQLVKNEYPLETYKMGLLIGMDDTNQKICYLYYYDFDLDELDNLDEYIKSNFYMQ